jgi:hypothetical protein
METSNPLFGWLASQPAYIEVGMGILFCLVIAPVLLAVVAAGLTSIEQSFGRILSQSGLLSTGPSAANKWLPLRRAVAQELPWLRKALHKLQA